MVNMASASEMTSCSWSEERRIEPGEVVEEEKRVELQQKYYQ